MYKIVLITFVLTLITSCSVLKKSGANRHAIQTENINSEPDVKLKERNLSENSFYIQKAEVEIRRGGERERFIASWKYEISGQSLISIRTKTGIEVARIYIDRDTVLVNDRINRILYYGKPGFIKRNYGVPAEYFPLLIGDYIEGSGNNVKEINCKQGKASLGVSLKGILTEYLIDCNKNKLVGADLYNDKRAKTAELRFFDFIRRDGGIMASRILVKYYDINAQMSINIDKIEYPWEGNITFIPGKGYEKQLLN